jgi:UDP-N-acetylmuramate: L-alanyl-gamma-D-glutamyl-meso-diaminopimelate ligase
MRRNVLQDALAQSLSLADQVIIAAIFKSEAIPAAERLDLDRVIREIEKRGKQARVLADADAIVNTIAPELKRGDVVAILSNGGFGGIYEKLPERLRSLGIEG